MIYLILLCLTVVLPLDCELLETETRQFLFFSSLTSSVAVLWLEMFTNIKTKLCSRASFILVSFGTTNAAPPIVVYFRVVYIGHMTLQRHSSIVYTVCQMFLTKSDMTRNPCLWMANFNDHYTSKQLKNIFCSNTKDVQKYSIQLYLYNSALLLSQYLCQYH